MGHCLDIQEDPQNLEQILSDCKETLKYCVKTGKLILFLHHSDLIISKFKLDTFTNSILVSDGVIDMPTPTFSDRAPENALL